MKKATPQAAEFIAVLLHGVTAIHMLHLLCKGPGSYAKHVALGDLYEGLEDLADSLAEAYFGCASLIEEYPSTKFPSFSTTSSAINYVEQLYEYVEEKRSKMGSESHIQNTVDEICSLISSALYKLKELA